MKRIIFLILIVLAEMVSQLIVSGIAIARENMPQKNNQTSSSQAEQRRSSFQVPKGYMLFEEDILLPEDYFENNESVFNTNFWPDSIVPYEFDANVTQANRTAMLNAMTEWENDANIDFVLRTTEVDYIHIQDDNGNYSTGVGMQGGRQTIGIFNWNWRFIMAHELAHALGIWHEQSRSDRDDYVQINWDNMGTSPDTVWQFTKQTGADVYPKQDYALPDTLTYDFDSMMHYNQFAFSNNGQPTITVLTPNQGWQNQIGQRNHISLLDSLTMSFLYPEDDWRFVDWTNGGRVVSGTFISPYINVSYGYSFTPANSTLWIQPGTYQDTGTFDKAMTLRAPLGNVTIGTSVITSIVANDKEKQESFNLTIDSVQALSKITDPLSETVIPNEFSLSQNYPNPFNPTTTIKYALKEDVKVSLKIYNMLGQEVRNLVEEPQTAGFREVIWDGKNDFGQRVASGVYLYRIVADNYIQTRRMMLLK